MVYKLEIAQYVFTKIEIYKYIAIGVEFEEARKSNAYKVAGNPTIKIDTIEDLNHFVDKFGEIIFDGNTITIYNDYVE